MKKILIVEDDIDITELERDYLEINQYQVAVAHDGIEGLKKALAEPFDLFILDVMLPGMDGFELCKAIRQHTLAPILFVSAKTEDIDKIRGLGLGADDYIVKPFSPSELVARVTANIKRYDALFNLGRNAPFEDNTVVVGSLKVQLDARRVYKDGIEVSLTNKEFEILEFFLRHPNKVFSREELFNKIWDLDSFGDITTVTVHIKRLREKIEPDPEKPVFIETVWGAGYRFTIRE